MPPNVNTRRAIARGSEAPSWVKEVGTSLWAAPSGGWCVSKLRFLDWAPSPDEPGYHVVPAHLAKAALFAPKIARHELLLKTTQCLAPNAATAASTTAAASTAATSTDANCAATSAAGTTSGGVLGAHFYFHVKMLLWLSVVFAHVALGSVAVPIWIEAGDIDLTWAGHCHLEVMTDHPLVFGMASLQCKSLRVLVELLLGLQRPREEEPAVRSASQAISLRALMDVVLDLDCPA